MVDNPSTRGSSTCRSDPLAQHARDLRLQDGKHSLDEGVLTRPTGSEAVMAEQMAHLAALDEHPRINIRVLPHNSWLTTGLQGAFILAGGPGMPDMVYLESIITGQITADSERVREVRLKYEMLHNEALPRRASLQLIREMAEKWTN
nr:DUF5753 domain-containing protein [Nonomuraea coxensis]